MFAGHTDVVPPGNETAWSHPPFAGEIADGVLYGRGAVDMKGGIAACIAAALDHLAARGGKPKGSISFLIAGDEESVAVNGTIKLLDWAAKRGEKFDHCLLAEPSNRETLGDTIKIGRRGSLNGILTVHGKQGHVAYPERAENPVRGLAALIIALKAEPLDTGSDAFRSVQSRIHLDRCRQPDRQPHSRRSARALQHPLQRPPQRGIAEDADRAARGRRPAHGKIRFSFEWEPSNADVFVVEPGPFTDLVAGAVTERDRPQAEISTTGGTSDARFIKNYCPVVEFGLVGQTMHQVDERVPVADLVALTAIYRRIWTGIFESGYWSRAQ